MTHPQLSGYLTRAALVGMAIFCGAARGSESDRTQAAPSALLWQCPHSGQFQHLVADRRAKGFTVYHEYFYGPSRSPGTLRNLAPGVSYRADWFDPRIGAWTPIDMNLRADNGQWKILTRPDGDWVLVVRKQNRTAATQMSAR